MPSELFAAMRGANANIMTIKCQAIAGGINNVFAVISPWNNANNNPGAWLSIHSRSVAGGCAACDDLTCTTQAILDDCIKAGWVNLAGGAHRGIGGLDTNGYAMAKFFETEHRGAHYLAALRALEEIFKGTKIYGSTYHGNPWPWAIEFPLKSM